MKQRSDPLSSIQEDVGRPAGQEKAETNWELTRVHSDHYKLGLR